MPTCSPSRYTELVNLSQDAGAQRGDISTLAKRVKAEASEEAQVQLLANEREALSDQISSTSCRQRKAAGGKAGQAVAQPVPRRHRQSRDRR